MLDEQIIDLYWERSQEAIPQSSQKYGKYCHSIAWHILYDESDSEECVNDTWLRAWYAMPPQRPAVLKAFLGKITRNLALHVYEKQHAARRGGGETALCLEELSECIADRGGTENVVEQAVLAETLNRFLSTLTPEDRALFVGRYWYMRSIQEIVRSSGMKESQLKMRLLRMRRRLKEMLEKEGIVV